MHRPSQGGEKLWVRSEALECVQLAAAFSGGSLLPALVLGRPGQAPFTGGTPVEQTSRQQAGAKAAASCTHSRTSLHMPGGRPVTCVSRTLERSVGLTWAIRRRILPA
jgi:hypothetical protein